MPPLDGTSLKSEAVLPSPQLRQRSVRQKLQHNQQCVKLDAIPTPGGSPGGVPLLSVAAGRAPRATVWREDMSAAAAALLCIGNSSNSSQAWALASTYAAAEHAGTSQHRSVSMSEASGSGASESSTWAAPSAREPNHRPAQSASMPFLSRQYIRVPTATDTDAHSPGPLPAKPRRSKAAIREYMPYGPEQNRCKCGKRISATHRPCKSGLVLLCERFTQQFGQLTAGGEPSCLPLNDVAAALAVPRRRLYDILNVLEAVEVVQRACKLTYRWQGVAHIGGLASRLAHDERQGRPLEDRPRKVSVAGVARQSGEPGGAAAGNSLWHLSRKLVRLLVTHQGALSLADAATMLVDGPAHKLCNARTIERRLYDVGSILTTVGFIEKVYLPNRQPAFQWVAAVELTPGVPSAVQTEPSRDASPGPSNASCDDSHLVMTKGSP